MIGWWSKHFHRSVEITQNINILKCTSLRAARAMHLSHHPPKHQTPNLEMSSTIHDASNVKIKLYHPMLTWVLMKQHTPSYTVYPIHVVCVCRSVSAFFIMFQHHLGQMQLHSAPWQRCANVSDGSPEVEMIEPTNLCNAKTQKILCHDSFLCWVVPVNAQK